MSIHPSLSSADKTKRHRSVLKRFEKLKVLMEKGKWLVGDSIFRLPKIKMLKIKIKKEKVEEKEEGAVATAATGVDTKATEATEKSKEEGAEKKKVK